MNTSNDAQAIQTGPWWSRILTNKNAVIALVALYLVYFVTGVFDTRLTEIGAQAARIEQNLESHRTAEQQHYTKLEDLLLRLNDQAVLNTRLQREICASNAKSSAAVRKCYDPDVK